MLYLFCPTAGAIRLFVQKLPCQFLSEILSILENLLNYQISLGIVAQSFVFLMARSHDAKCSQFACDVRAVGKAP